jgi:hypothetical protein
VKEARLKTTLTTIPICSPKNLNPNNTPIYIALNRRNFNKTTAGLGYWMVQQWLIRSLRVRVSRQRENRPAVRFPV